MNALRTSRSIHRSQSLHTPQFRPSATVAIPCVSFDAALPARVALSPCRREAAQAERLSRRLVFGAVAPASNAPESVGSKVVFSCHENRSSTVFATTSNNLALRDHPIWDAPQMGRIPKRPPLPAVAPDLGLTVSVTLVYALALSGFGRCSHKTNPYRSAYVRA